MSKAEEIIIENAEFNPRVRQYWLAAGAVFLAITIIGFPLAVIWLLVGLKVTQRHLENLECTLTSRAIRVKRGIWVKEEITVPLEKITDLKLVQGPIMRHFGVAKLAVETAGGAGPEGSAAVSIVGLKDTWGFRERALEAKEADAEGPAKDQFQGDGEATLPDLLDLLEEMRDLLSSIEQHLAKK